MRGDVLHAAVCVFGEGASKISCSIRELSKDGIRVSFVFPQKVPGRFWVINLANKMAYEVKPVWNVGTKTGLSIISRLALDDISDPKFRFLRRIWLDRVKR